MPRTTPDPQLPRCVWCGFTPDEPMWATVDAGQPGIMCLGCIANQRAGGHTVAIIRRASRMESA